jgi:glutamyl-Q tRNA(Asp) synthetase
MQPFITRFAPSPTGLLHLGHAFSAFTAARAAEAAGGRFLLRIEDIDQGRCKLEFEAAIYDDLGWLGLDWEKPVRRQSDHFNDYAAALERLTRLGVVYRCFKTRREILEDIARAPHLSADGPEGPQYVGEPLPADEEAARLDAGEPFAWRLSLAACRDVLGDKFKRLSFTEETIVPPHAAKSIPAKPEIFGDAVVARKDAGTSYHLASVHDDAVQGVTHVIRGEDLAAAAHLHTLLQALLGYGRPVYRHHRLVTDETGKRFAKRDKSATIRAHRQAGESPKTILAAFGLT